MSSVGDERWLWRLVCTLAVAVARDGFEAPDRPHLDVEAVGIEFGEEVPAEHAVVGLRVEEVAERTVAAAAPVPAAVGVPAGVTPRCRGCPP